MLADEEIDAVYIASPPEHHASQAIAALRQNKHVLVEKPMAVSLDDARAMARTARHQDRQLLVGPSHGYDPPVALASEIAGSDRYGPAMFVQAMAYTDFVYRPRRSEELDRSTGGGVVHSQATHHIDMVRRIIASPVKAVQAQKFDWDPSRRTDGAYVALLKFESGAAATISYSGYARFDSDALAGWVGEFGGRKSFRAHRRSRATLAEGNEATAKAARGYGAGAPASVAPIGHDHFGLCLASCPGADIELTPRGVIVHAGGRPEIIDSPLPRAPREAVADMLTAAVIDGIAPLFNGQWGLETLACVHAILRSANENREVALVEILNAPRQGT